MKLQTQIPLEKQKDNLFDYHSKVLLLGSCFVENIGNKLAYFKFQSLQNPFGILFHPKAIEKLVHYALHEKQYTEQDLFFHNEQWHCYDTHSKLSSNSKEDILKALNDQLDITTKSLNNSTHIIITLGTAWVYKDYKTNLPVANCHKVPQKDFIKELLSVKEVTDSLQMIVNQIHRVNPTATIIFTVSPIRHIKDGFVQNSQSKSHLVSAIHQLINEHPARTENVGSGGLSITHKSVQVENRQSCYFPSYEIMLDELRDYRFYAEDMLHPNQIAIDYIWEKFQHVWISSAVSQTMEDVDAIQKGLRHKPFNPNSEAYKKFLEDLNAKKEKLRSVYSHMSF